MGGKKWINPLNNTIKYYYSPWFKPWAINDKQYIITFQRFEKSTFAMRRRFGLWRRVEIGKSIK